MMNEKYKYDWNTQRNLIDACGCCPDIDMIKHYIELGVDIQCQENQPLLSACIYGNFDIVKFLIENTDANIRAIDNNTLKWIKKFKHTEVLDYIQNIKDGLKNEKRN